MRRALVCLAVACFGTPLAATATDQSKASTRGAGALPIHDGALELSLDQAVELAIDRNLDVELVRFDPYVAREQLGTAWGSYDPELFGEGGLVDAQEQSANALQGLGLFKQRTWDGVAGLRGLVPWLGASYEVSYSNAEVETSLPFAVFSPEYTGSYQASVQLPLLRGLFWDDAWTQVRLARVGVGLSDEQFRTDLMDIVQRTEDAYWALIASQDERRVAEKSLETANALLDQTQAQFEVGVVSKVEVVQAEAGVADREFVLIRAQATERNTQDALIDVVLGPYLEPESDISVVATDRPEEVTVREVSTTAATERAMARRPELALARKQIEARKIEKSKTSNDRLPRLDVVGSFGQSGISGDISDDLNTAALGLPAGIAPAQPERHNWTDDNEDLFTGDAARTYSIRGLLSIPLGNTAARHQHRLAEFELQRAETALRRLEQSIVSEIRRAARNLEASLQGIEAARRAEAAAAEQLRAERVRLEHGESTPFDVLLREEDLVRAQAQKIFAEQTYHNSVTALDRAQGTILERQQIVVEEAATLR
jgi:outer membrane protein TolC